MMYQPICVIMTLYIRDPMDFFEAALSSIEVQVGLAERPRVYLCVDGDLTAAQSVWLSENRNRFYKIIVNKKNQGLASSLNNLLDLLEDEEFVFRMDGDDISEPDRFHRQIAFMRENPGVSLVGCQVQDIDENGQKIGKRFYPTESSACAAAMTSVMPILHPTFCLRAEAIRTHDLRYPEAYLTEDLAFVATMHQRGLRIANLPEVLFQWRLGPNFFVRRRSMRRGWQEMKWYSKIIWKQSGFLSFLYVVAFGKFILRCLPTKAQAFVYQSGLRQFLLRARARE